MGVFLVLELWMTQYTLDYQLSEPQPGDKNQKKSLSPFMIITLITHPLLSCLSRHSISYSNLPHSVSLSMINHFKLKSCIYFVEIQMTV